MPRFRIATALALCLAAPALAQAQIAQAPIAQATLDSLSTPDRVETRAGLLTFRDGAPSAETVAKVYDHIDFAHAYDAFVNTFQLANMEAIHEGFLAAGVKDNEILLFSKLMDSQSLFLTANADTVYFVGMLDLSQGPTVLETPPGALGTLDDYFWRWIVDFGAPGPDRGEGGRYLVLPPGYDGPLPEGGFYVVRSRTNRAVILGRAFMVDDDPAPTVATIRAKTKIYPYAPGGLGSSVAEFLTGKTRLAPLTEPPATVFHEGSGLALNTIPPGDARAFALMDKAVQAEPATALDPELMGPLAAIGIVKGKPFAPDERMRRILDEAAALGNAAGRTLLLSPRDPSWYYYPDSAWMNFLFVSGSEFETPIPEVTPEGVKPFPPTGYRTLDARTAFFYGITGITPAMSMRVPGIGSQYLFAVRDADKAFFDGAKTYKVVLPKDIPEANFWSFTLYDNQTRSMLATPQLYPRAGSQDFPSPKAEAAADGTTTIWFSPEQPEGVGRGNWIQTDPKKGWFTILRLYSPLEPFFTKAWRPGEIERVR